jgi:cytochrome c553
MINVLAPVIRIVLFTAALINLSACSEATSPQQLQLVADLTEPQRQLFEQGKLSAHTCKACHGRAGISNSPMYPSIAGQAETELANALLAYRSGERKHALMTPQARGLNDAEISALAFYFSLHTAAPE